MLDFLTLKNYHISDLIRRSQNITGIINSSVFSQKFSTGRVLDRMGVILPCLTNIILEIWSIDDETRPKYSKNWKNLQLICVFGGKYGGEAKVGDKLYKVFRVDSQNSKRTRFLWLSEDSPTFWIKPILQRDDKDDYFFDCDDTWPDPLPIGDGILRKSDGSYLAKPISKFMGHLHTDHFSEIHFPSLVEVYKKVRKGVDGAVDLLTGKSIFDELNFDR